MRLRDADNTVINMVRLQLIHLLLLRIQLMDCCQLFNLCVGKTIDAKLDQQLILALREHYREKLYKDNRRALKHEVRLLDALFENPIITKTDVKEMLNVSYPTASTTVDYFIELGILWKNNPDRQRNKKYGFSQYLAILERGTE